MERVGVLEYLKKMLHLDKSNVIHKAAVEKILDMTFKSLKDEVLPSYLELAKANQIGFNPAVKVILENTLKVKSSKDQTVTLTNVIKDLIKNESVIRELVKGMPESIPTNYITAKNALALSLVSSVCSFTLSSLDIAIMMVTKQNEKDFSDSVMTQMSNSLSSLPSLLNYVKNIKKTISDIGKADDEININDDNVRLEAILKSKAGLPDIPNLGFAFIGRIAYTIGTWLVDIEMKNYEALKQKKAYLLKRLLEIENEANNAPDDARLKRAKEVYIEEIEKTNYKILKIENS